MAALLSAVCPRLLLLVDAEEERKTESESRVGNSTFSFDPASVASGFPLRSYNHPAIERVWHSAFFDRGYWVRGAPWGAAVLFVCPECD